jgi:hypothetical protein
MYNKVGVQNYVWSIYNKRYEWAKLKRKLSMFVTCLHDVALWLLSISLPPRFRVWSTLVPSRHHMGSISAPHETLFCQIKGGAGHYSSTVPPVCDSASEGVIWQKSLPDLIFPKYVYLLSFQCHFTGYYKKGFSFFLTCSMSGACG